MDTNGTPKQQLVERLKSANNILVTVSRNPSVDQLAACIGLTLVLNKLGKHATAVFSGQVPSTIEFLKPEETIEQNTDSLRDFIIALDKSKADKLRYKVEDTVVKIFITPYRTSLSADDLEFSQGDFNVDAVVALGVGQQQDLDEAITAHGRILHDATVTTINTTPDGSLGTINWHDPSASSLCELVEEVVHDLGTDVLDGQIATALLTGIVAETNRFSNEKTTPQTMSVSAALMSAGANQQLVASELGAPVSPLTETSPPKSSDNDAEQTATPSSEPPKPDDGTLEITHPHDDEGVIAQEPDVAEGSSDTAIPPSENDTLADPETDGNDEHDQQTTEEPKPSRLIIEPPTLGGTLTASSKPETEIEVPADPLSLPATMGEQPILSHSEPVGQAMQPAPADWVPPTPQEPMVPESPSISLPQPTNAHVENSPSTEAPVSSESGPHSETLSQLEKDVNSPHVETPTLDAARNEVIDAINSAPPIPEPIQALNAQPIDLQPSPETQAVVEASTEFDPQAFGVINDPDAAPAVPEPPVTNPSPSIPEQPSPYLSPQPLNPATSAAAEPLVSDPSIPPVPPPLPPSVYAPPTHTPGQQ